MKGKVSNDVLEKMIQARKEGKTYKEIEQSFGVSRWVTVKYLKNIETEKSVSEEIWKNAELVAENYLSQNGFETLINLNRISPQSHFDILAFKNGEKWLIDVTINESKDMVSKILRVVENFRCAVLYVSHDLQRFQLYELKRVEAITIEMPRKV